MIRNFGSQLSCKMVRDREFVSIEDNVAYVESKNVMTL